MIVEQRTYKIRNGCMARFLKLVKEEALPIQAPILGNLIAYFTTEIGALSTVTHLWGFADLNDRTERRRQLAADKRWQVFIPQLSELIEHAENRILIPTDFSPLRALPVDGHDGTAVRPAMPSSMP
jgi:hypothetical protein